MTVLHYCSLVHFAIRQAKPEPFNAKHPACEQWFCDAGQAGVALKSAIQGNVDKALKLAEPLAEKYWSHIDQAQAELLQASH